MSEALDCTRVEHALTERLGRGAGPASGDDAVDAHVAGCPPCAALERRLQGVLGALCGDDVPDPGAAYWQGFAARVRGSLETAGGGRSVRSRWPLWAGLAAAAASLLLLIALPGGEGAPPAPDAGAAVTQASGGGAAGAGTSRGGTEIDRLLDDFFGEAGLGPVSDSVGRLDVEEREKLLEALQAELESAA